MTTLITIIPVEIMVVVGLCIFGWLAWTNPAPCPKEYRTRGGDIVEYCDFDPNRGWILKEKP